jgi:hypothetical protein
MEICPAALDLHVGLVNALRIAGSACEAVPTFFELRGIALDPAHDRRVRQINSALGHNLHEIAKTQLEPKIPSDADNMATLEKIINVEHMRSLL